MRTPQFPLSRSPAGVDDQHVVSLSNGPLRRPGDHGRRSLVRVQRYYDVGAGSLRPLGQLLHSSRPEERPQDMVRRTVAITVWRTDRELSQKRSHEWFFKSCVIMGNEIFQQKVPRMVPTISKNCARMDHDLFTENGPKNGSKTGHNWFEERSQQFYPVTNMRTY